MINEVRKLGNKLIIEQKKCYRLIPSLTRSHHRLLSLKTDHKILFLFFMDNNDYIHITEKQHFFSVP